VPVTSNQLPPPLPQRLQRLQEASSRLSSLASISEIAGLAALGDLDFAGVIDEHLDDLGDLPLLGSGSAGEEDSPWDGGREPGPALGGSFRLGIPRLEYDTPRSHPESMEDGQSQDSERDLRYLRISNSGRKQFQEYAKSLAEQMSVECADCNPYIQALAAHRQELEEQVVNLDEERVDSLAARLATQRSSALAELALPSLSSSSLGPSAARAPRREASEDSLFPGIFCGGAAGCFPEYAGKRRRHHNFVAASPGRELSDQSSSTSTADPGSDIGAAGSIGRQLSRASTREAPSPPGLPVRVGRSRVRLDDTDRDGFLEALGLTNKGWPD